MPKSMTFLEKIQHKIFGIRAQLFGKKIESFDTDGKFSARCVSYQYKDRFFVKSLKLEQKD